MRYNMQYSPQTSLQTPEQKQMGLFLHLSQYRLCSFIFPLGIVLPIVLWQTQKDKIAGARRTRQDGHQLDDLVTIYGVVSFVLMFVLDRVSYGLGGVGSWAIIFPIVGGR